MNGIQTVQTFWTPDKTFTVNNIQTGEDPKFYLFLFGIKNCTVKTNNKQTQKKQFMGTC